MNQIQSKFSRMTGSIALASAFLCVSTLGCGPKAPVDENRTVISGTVTFNGTPLKAGTIRFDSSDKHIGTSTSIASDGRYSTNRVPLGSNTVSIETESLQYGSPHLYVKIPDKYADPSKSGLTVDVKPGANENVNFELKP
jgi:hypothetical protein